MPLLMNMFWKSVLTGLGSLGHDVANVIGGRMPEDLAQALSPFDTFGTQTIGVVVVGLLTMADEVHSRLSRSSSSSKCDDGKQLHIENYSGSWKAEK